MQTQLKNIEEYNNTNEIRSFYREIGTKENSNKSRIQSENNPLLTSEQPVLERKKQHFNTLLNKYDLPSQPSTHTSEANLPPPTTPEIVEAINQLQ